jgi:hypothetical protein
MANETNEHANSNTGQLSGVAFLLILPFLSIAVSLLGMNYKFCDLVD